MVVGVHSRRLDCASQDAEPGCSHTHTHMAASQWSLSSAGWGLQGYRLNPTFLSTLKPAGSAGSPETHRKTFPPGK